MTTNFNPGDRVRVLKGRGDLAAMVGKNGTIFGSTATVSPLWIVRIDHEAYTSDNTGALLNPSEIELIARKVKFGEFEICLSYSHDSFDRGWSYFVRYALEHQLTPLENPFTALPKDDYGVTLEYAILDAKRRTLEAVEKQIRLKRRQVEVLESAMRSIEEITY